MTTNQEVGGSNPPGRKPFDISFSMQSGAKNIILCGGSGLIGQALYRFFTQKKHHCTIFTRQASSQNLRWDPARRWLNPDVFKSADVIINLAGVGIADHLWSRVRKREILESRIKTTRFLYDKLVELKHTPEIFINASAIGYYGHVREGFVSEESPAGNGFLSYVAQEWEREALRIQDLGIRTVIFRIGNVLSHEGGMFPEMYRVTRFYMGSRLGNGKQMISWIHIKDLCSLFLLAIEKKKFQGIYNAVSPNPVSNAVFMKSLSHLLDKQNLIPSIPSFILKSVMGKRSSLLLEGVAVSAQKIMFTGFRFHYPELNKAIKHLLEYYSKLKKTRKKIKKRIKIFKKVNLIT